MAVLMHHIPAAMAISTEAREFFVTLGERITRLRKARGITQVQLAETLGVSQQMVQAYEVGRRRIQVSALPVVAHALSISLKALFGEAERGNRKRGPASRLRQQVELNGQLPKTRQRFVSDMLDTVLGQSGH